MAVHAVTFGADPSAVHLITGATGSRASTVAESGRARERERRTALPPHGPPALARRGIAVLVAACLTTLALLATGIPAAQAHDELLGSSPEAGATLDAAPAAIELEFSGEVQQLGTEVVVTAVDGTPSRTGPSRSTAPP